MRPLLAPWMTVTRIRTENLYVCCYLRRWGLGERGWDVFREVAGVLVSFEWWIRNSLIRQRRQRIMNLNRLIQRIRIIRPIIIILIQIWNLYLFINTNNINSSSSLRLTKLWFFLQMRKINTLIFNLRFLLLCFCIW